MRLGIGLLVTSLVLPMAAARADDLRVMSFNIRLDTPKDGENAWPKRREMLFRAIERFGPDLLGLQEVLPSQAAELKARFGGKFDFVGVPRDDGKSRGETAAVLFRRQRFEKVRAGHFWLSQTPEVAGSKGWDANIPRMVTWVELRDLANGGRTLFFFNTHFDHQGKTARLESAKLLRSRILEIARDAPVIVAGDFNASEGSPPHVQMTGDGLPRLIDTFAEKFAAATTQRSTFHGFTGNSAGERRIDWVLRCEAFVTQQADIDRYHEDNRFPSDHFAATAVLRWRE